MIRYTTVKQTVITVQRFNHRVTVHDRAAALLFKLNIYNVINMNATNNLHHVLYRIQKTIVNTKTVKQRNATHTHAHITDILVYNTKLNMAALVKQLVGVDEFLSNLQSLPSFHRVQELQLEKLMTSIKQKVMDDQGFAETSKAAEEMKHFDKD